MKLKKFAAACVAALSLFGAASQAQILRFEDDNIEFLLNQNLTPKLSGNIAQGDVLVSVFEINSYTLNGVNILPAGFELTGISVTQVTNQPTAGLGSVIEFGAYTGGFNAVAGTAVSGGGAGGGTMVAMWLNSTADFDLQLNFSANPTTNCISRVQCQAAAVGGTSSSLLQLDGFYGDADQFWRAVVTSALGTDPALARTVAGSLNLATFDAALSTLFNASGPIGFQNIITGLPCAGGTVAADGCIAGPTLSGPAKGGAGLYDGGVPGGGLYADGAFARSDFDAQKILAQKVPEPSSLALAGLMLLGLAGVARRKH